MIVKKLIIPTSILAVLLLVCSLYSSRMAFPSTESIEEPSSFLGAKVTQAAVHQHGETHNNISANSPPPITRPLSDLAQSQAAHYRNHTGILLNVHITHHAGTTFCQKVGHAPSAKGRVPGFACWKVRGEDLVASNKYPHTNPWHANETARNVQLVRHYFHMISWEYAVPPVVPLEATRWEDPYLFSVFIIRHPIHRLMAGDRQVARDFPGVLKGTANATTLESYALASSYTDNYALRILSGREYGQEIDRGDLRLAKDVVRRFSVVLDIDCLDKSLELLAWREWGLSELGKVRRRQPKKSPQERIGNATVYEKLLKRNELDIELYEWAKQRSYVDCSKLNSTGKRRL